MRLSVVDTETAVDNIVFLAWQRAVEVLHECEVAATENVGNENLKKRLEEAQATADDLSDLVYRIDSAGEKILLVHEVEK